MLMVKKCAFFLLLLGIMAGCAFPISFGKADADDPFASVRIKAIRFLRTPARWESDKIAIRWPDRMFPLIIRVSRWFASEESLAQARAGADFWTRRTNILFSIEWGDDALIDACAFKSQGLPAALREGVIYLQPRVPCQSYFAAYAYVFRVGNEIRAGVIDIHPERLKSKPDITEDIMHEIGHLLGVSHTYNGSVMDPGLSPPLEIPPYMAEAFRILYFELQPGDPIPSPTP